MAKVQIEFVNGDLDVVDDPVKGRPCVTVNVKSAVGDEICFGQWALVDTGSDITIVGEALLLGLDHLVRQTVRAHNQDGETQDSLIEGIELEIVGLDGPVSLTVVARRKMIPAIDVVIGRDVLARYKMVYDPGSEECTLETQQR